MVKTMLAAIVAILFTTSAKAIPFPDYEIKEDAEYCQFGHGIALDAKTCLQLQYNSKSISRMWWNKLSEVQQKDCVSHGFVVYPQLSACVTSNIDFAKYQ